MDAYVQKGRERLRRGFTTGTCAAAAAQGAARFLLTGRRPECSQVTLPSGEPVILEIAGSLRGDDWAQCSVIKDAGDDPDITNGMEIRARVSLLPGADGQILIDGAEGVGRVTKPGLDQPVGAAAINSTPRRMIAGAVSGAVRESAWKGGLQVLISIPGGEEKAASTLNPVLGIEGGLSVLGRSGIVEPMSRQALLETIRTQIRQQLQLQAEAGHREKILLMAPGNYGLDYLSDCHGVAPDEVIKVSNYIGDSMDLAAAEGARTVILVGHIGKMVKLAGGIMNTHSGNADARLELLAANALRAGADAQTCLRILSCVTTEAALDLLAESHLLTETMSHIIKKALQYLDRRAGTDMQIRAAFFSTAYGLLACSPDFEDQLAVYLDAVRSCT